MDLMDSTLAELTAGYRQLGKTWTCNYCTATFTNVDQIQHHLDEQHGGTLAALLTSDSKYNTLTANQRQLLSAFHEKVKDDLIAERLQKSASTIRHQKFTFREKAKQAKLYLAQYAAAFGTTEPTPEYLPIPPAATAQDERFKITKADYQQLIQRAFDFTKDQLVLKKWPKGEKKRITLLYRISVEFDFRTLYSQSEIDEKLQLISADYGILRRYLIDYGFLARTTDNRTYWRIF